MLVFFHTTLANADSFEAIAQELAPGLATRHVVRADLLDRGRELGSGSLALKQEVALAIEESIQEGDALLLCTCSTIGAGADLAVHSRIPVLRVDRPMAGAAVAYGNRILVAACLASTVQATEDLIREAKPDANIETLLIEDAWPDWVAGNKQAYWTRIANSIEQHIHHFDAVVLAQASMAGAADLVTNSTVPVLSSPRLGVGTAISQMAGQVQKTGVITA